MCRLGSVEPPWPGCACRLSFNHAIQYVHPRTLDSIAHNLFGPDLLQLARAVNELGGVGLGHDLALVGLLHKVLVSLLVGELDRILLRLEVEAGALHVVCTGLPAHQRVLPPVALGEDVPVHAPLVAVPVAGLGGGLCGAVDAEAVLVAVSDRE